jgi:hypothetical protein
MDKLNPAEPHPVRKRANPKRLLVIAVMSFATMACTCYGISIFGYSLRQNAVRVERTVASNTLSVWLDFSADGIFTPMQTAQIKALTTGDDLIGLPPFLSELADKGYVAIRVPHAPPTYTLSSLVPGIPPFSPAVAFSYYSPPNTTTVTTVEVTVTRWITYESIVNALYPIGNNRSHWEVWRLPPGDSLPIPLGPFRLKPGFPASLELAFRLNFGSNVDALNCAGCPVQALIYNGYNFIGPFEAAINFEDSAPPGNPHAAFGARCSVEGLQDPTIVQYISPTVPFTHVMSLENYDSITRVFTITATSTQGWSYNYYRRAPSAALVPIAALPFTVTVGPASNVWPKAGCLNLLAVDTPTISITDKLRETLILTATSIVSPTSVRASGYSLALAPAYQLDENNYQYHIYLPLVLRQY